MWASLRAVLDRQPDPAPLEVLDVGGGTGGSAVRLAELGHRVTVVDPSPDSLAALERRADETGVEVRGLQGDAADLERLVEPGSVHLVLLHTVLEHVEDPAAVLTAVSRCVRPRGAVSVLATNALAAVLHRALAGDPDGALHVLRSPQGRSGAHDPVPRRFTGAELLRLVEGTGLRADAPAGVRVFTDLVPGRLFDTGEASAQTLAELEREASAHPTLSGIATQIHVLGWRTA
ncbi:methyltransferase domain-containing protein [Spiractinospora alimapuensis]|nr:methyltransferase domain-containing protein [Spiractinospora alimapuensis]